MLCGAELQETTHTPTSQGRCRHRIRLPPPQNHLAADVIKPKNTRSLKNGSHQSQENTLYRKLPLFKPYNTERRAPPRVRGFCWSHSRKRLDGGFISRRRRLEQQLRHLVKEERAAVSKQKRENVRNVQ